MLIPRNLKLAILDSARYSPVILVNGGRQTGKSTLVKGLFSPDNEQPQYISMDDLAVVSGAIKSPKTFVQGLGKRVIIDEIQRAPELFLSIKESVDQKRIPGRFFLTGSANVLNLPKLSESLVGRMEIFTLWSLSQGEIRGRQEAFIDALFDQPPIGPVKSITLKELLQAISLGGFPDVLKRDNRKVRHAWYASYLRTILERDVKELSNIEGLTELPDLLRLLATRAGGLLNLADLSRTLAIPYMTLKRYFNLLSMVFLVVSIPPWYNNRGQRLVKSPKIFISDTGLLCDLLGLDGVGLEANRPILGLVFENFIVTELTKQIAWSNVQPRMYHFRTTTGHETDIVLEAADGKVVGIECKASSTVTASDFKGMDVLREQAGEKFHRGIVLYTGTEAVSFGSNYQAVPVSALWEISSRTAPMLYEA